MSGSGPPRRPLGAPPPQAASRPHEASPPPDASGPHGASEPQSAPPPPEAPVPSRATLSGWGRARAAPVALLRPGDNEAVRAALPLARSRGLIARGMGRSYGDAAQLTDGLVLDMTQHEGFELDEHAGIVIAEAGVTLGELLRFAAPRGWMVPVLPGTQHVTVGGAIASDIHGKNHGVSGTFGTHVQALGLLTAQGDTLELTWQDELFRATVGGMGLTGVILWARIAFAPITSPLLAVDTDRVAGLDEALAALTVPGGPYRVAWLDLLCATPGRGVVTRADHLDGSDARSAQGGSATVSARIAVPERWPGGLLRPATVRAFNEMRFRRTPRRERGHPESIGSHMFPLDALAGWPRLYGRHGFVQYQPVVPMGREDVLHTMIERLRRSRVPCYLCVLKDFGPANPAPLSFPIRGWTITLDLPAAAAGLEDLLHSLDELVAGAGGRVYLSKDVRMRADTVAAMYPRLEEWRAIRDSADPEGTWRSDLALRTGLVKPRARSASSVSTPNGEKRVLLVGGTSEIGLAIVRRLAGEGPVRACLLGRDPERLDEALSMLEQAGGIQGETVVLDADDVGSHGAVLERAFSRAGGFDLVVVAVGVLGAQSGLDADPAEAAEVMRVNFLGAGSLLIECLRAMRERGAGTMVVLSSVAAERPRAANAIYGAAKAGLDALAQGLADATAETGLRVLVVRPGFVKTRMTAGLAPAPMAVSADEVAHATVRALSGTAHTVWVPGRLRVVFAVLRHLPRGLFRRLPL